MSKNFRSYTIGLLAGQEYTLNVQGKMYAVIESVGEFTIVFDESSRIQKSVAGMGGSFVSPYSKVSLISDTAQSVTVIFGYGEFNDARATVNATINTTITPSDTLSNPADKLINGAAVLLVSADPNRKEVLIHVPSNAPNSVRIGSNSVTASAGLEIEIGSTVTLAIESALYAISTGSDVSVSILDLARV